MFGNRIISFWSGHDASFCVLENGRPLIHVERERHFRIKEEPGDSIALFFDLFGDISNVSRVVTCYQPTGIQAYKESFEKIKIAPFCVVGHHDAHTANAFFSSNFNEALVITTDGGGIENYEGFTAGITISHGKGTKLTSLKKIPLNESDVGGIWSRCTRYVFGYETGWPFGHQAGTVMALSALGDPQKMISFTEQMFHNAELNNAIRQHPPGHVKGMSAKDPRRPRHPILGQFEDFGKQDQQALFDFAAALQLATEEFIFDVIRNAPRFENLCLAGGVALNSLMVGKIRERFPHIKNVYVPPVPYDAGLTIGSAQYIWHNSMGMPRVEWDDCFSPYLGVKYTEKDVDDAITGLNIGTCDDCYVLSLIDNGEVVSVFNGKAESGRRALGNRSILADPRNPQMKDRINEKVKHRQSFRPYAPSILYEHVNDWFEDPCYSPYMSFVLKFKPEQAKRVPAVVHFDGTARLQTVTAKTNPWYHRFLTDWYQKTGVPILLNTSFNDREPIVESPKNAVDCFNKTDIDHLYFPEYNLLVSK